MDKKEILDILDNAKDERGAVPMRLVRQAFDKLAQPKERTDKRTETHARDCISRAEAIELKPEFLNPNVNRETKEQTTIDRAYARGWNSCNTHWIKEIIEDLPSAQPEIVRCKDCLMHGVCRFERGLGLDGYCSQAERRTDGT